MRDNNTIECTKAYIWFHQIKEAKHIREIKFGLINFCEICLGCNM